MVTAFARRCGAELGGVGPDETYYRRAIRAGVQWIHANKQNVGGNVWGNKLPEGTDFAMLVDHGDMKRVASKARILRSKSRAHLLMHIRNDPHIGGSAGLTFIAGTRAQRKAPISRHARRQREIGYAYIYPLFFPLYPLYPLPTRRAYDASQQPRGCHSTQRPLVRRRVEPSEPRQCSSCVTALRDVGLRWARVRTSSYSSLSSEGPAVGKSLHPSYRPAQDPLRDRLLDRLLGRLLRLLLHRGRAVGDHHAV